MCCMSKPVETAVRKLLLHSLADIDLRYQDLTQAEKRLVTPAVFTDPVAWLKEGS